MTVNILYAEIYTICILILILLGIKVRSSLFLQEQRVLFFRVILFNSLLLFLDACWIFFNTGTSAVADEANWLLNCLYFIVSGFLGYYWFEFSETVQGSRLVRNSEYRLMAKLPLLILVLLTLASLKTGWLFYIDDHNTYTRGPWYSVQLLVAYGYVIFTALKAFYLSFYTRDYRRKSELRTLSAFVLPTIITGLLQTAFQGYPVLCLGNTIGILYVYMTMQEQLISLDALTKLNNRNQLFQFLSLKLSSFKPGDELYLLMMDIDYFKSINDKYGHVEGDNALKQVAGALMRVAAGKKCFICRYGGDEFVVISELQPEEHIQELCRSIREEIKQIKVPYELALSIGYAKYSADLKTQQAFLNKADQQLYIAKGSRPKRNS